jgi:hypothetical protein
MPTPLDPMRRVLNCPKRPLVPCGVGVSARDARAPFYWAEKYKPLNIKEASLPIYVAAQTMFCSVSKFFLKLHDSSGTIPPSLAFDCGML